VSESARSLMMNTPELLSERGQTHGSFRDNAFYGQSLRALWRSSAGWSAMPAEHREALDHIAGKLSRILSGQSTVADHWSDLAGYSELARKVCDK
jgi:hypothetical protein